MATYDAIIIGNWAKQDQRWTRPAGRGSGA